ncbi:uncharacterized protein LOC144452207 [Glandiceps talaboti]
MPYKLGMGYRRKNVVRKKAAAAKQQGESKQQVCHSKSPPSQNKTSTKEGQFDIYVEEQNPSSPALVSEPSSYQVTTEHVVPSVLPFPQPSIHAICNQPPLPDTNTAPNLPQHTTQSVEKNTALIHNPVGVLPQPPLLHPYPNPGTNIPYQLPYQVIRDGVRRCIFPPGWVIQSDDVCTKILYTVTDSKCSTIVAKQVVISSSLQWNVNIYGNDCSNSKALADFPSIITGVSIVLKLIDTVHHCTLCIGNPEEKFDEVANIRNGVFLSIGRMGDVIGYRHDVDLVNRRNEHFQSTLRSKQCLFILDGDKERCNACWVFRNSLFSLLSRDSKRKAVPENIEKTEHSSRAPLCYLTNQELYQRTQNIIKAKRRIDISKSRLCQKLVNSIKEDGVMLDDESACSLKSLAAECEGTVMTECEKGSFQRLFWQQQMKAINCSDKRGMRWHPMFIKWCLNIKLRSSAAYRAMKDSGVVQLPNERTLLDYTHWTKTGAGFSGDVIEQLYREVNYYDLEEHQKYVVLLHDEVKIKADLVYDKSSGELVGFINIGKFNHHLSDFERQMKGEGIEPQIAKYMLVFMVRGITIRLSYPLAHFPTNSINSDFLFKLVWEAVEVLELAGFKVLASTSDGASPNRRFYALHGNVNNDVTYKTMNIFAEDGRDIYFFSDVPHLIKTTRNCWANSGSHSKKRLLWNGEHIVWKTVEELYKADLERGGLFLCHKLKYEHIYLTSFARMKVKYATQVLSTTVANAIELYGRNGNREQLAPTVEFVRMFDKFFDCLNVRSFREGHRKRKPNLMAYESVDDPRLQWLTDDFLGYLTQWSARVDARPNLSKSEKQKMKLSHQTVVGLTMTVKSFVEVTSYLLGVPGITSVLSEKFNQDPLESYFGNHRQMKGGNEAPTVQQFNQNSNSLRMKSSSLLRIKGANVQTIAERCIDDTPLPRRR